MWKIVRIFSLMFLLAMMLPAKTLNAQNPDEPDLKDPAVKQGYREGNRDSTRGRFSVDGDNYQFVEDSEYLNDSNFVAPTKNPKLAGWLSFAVPGAGQIYNGQYWKVPIIYGAAGSLIFVSKFYNIRYKQIKNDERYFLAMAAGDTTSAGRSFYGLTNESDIVYYMRKYRRYRDMCYIGMFLVYMMNIFDAVVDAHLYDYNVTDDIALHIEPFTAPSSFYCNNAVFGARIVLKF